MERDKHKRPERPVVHQHVGMAFHFDSAGWILCAEAQLKEAEEERAAAEEERVKAETARKDAEVEREAAEEKREEKTKEAIEKVDKALEAIGGALRTYLIDLSGEYQSVALQVVAELAQGHAVIVYIRTEAGGELSTMVRVKDAGQAWLFTSALPEGTADGGIAQLSQVQYAISKATGNIQELRSEILTSLLTTDSVQDSIEDLDEKAGALPVSQRQAAALRQMVEKMDKNTLKKDDILILDGNGVTNPTK